MSRNKGKGGHTESTAQRDGRVGSAAHQFLITAPKQPDTDRRADDQTEQADGQADIQPLFDQHHFRFGKNPLQIVTGIFIYLKLLRTPAVHKIRDAVCHFAV